MQRADRVDQRIEQPQQDQCDVLVEVQLAVGRRRPARSRRRAVTPAAAGSRRSGLIPRIDLVASTSRCPPPPCPPPTIMRGRGTKRNTSSRRGAPKHRTEGRGANGMPNRIGKSPITSLRPRVRWRVCGGRPSSLGLPARCGCWGSRGRSGRPLSARRATGAPGRRRRTACPGC